MAAKQANKRQRRRAPRFTHQPKHTATRILRLLILLQNNICTRQEILEHLRPLYDPDSQYHPLHPLPPSAKRMLERDLTFLKHDMGFTIDSQRQRQTEVARLHIAPDANRLGLLLLLDQEVTTLALLKNLFAAPTQFDTTLPQTPPRPPRHPFAADIDNLVTRLASTLSPEQQATFAKTANAPVVFLNMDAVNDYVTHRVVIERLAQLIKSRVQIRFTYQSQDSAQPHEVHPVDPLFISSMEGHFYLYVYNHFVDDYREYRIDRITAASITSLHTPVPALPPRQFIEFHYWIDARLLRDGGSERWWQQVEEQRKIAIIDGQPVERALVRAVAFSEWRIIQQLHRYGPRVELVAPDHLRQRMRQELEATLRLYQSS